MSIPTPELITRLLQRNDTPASWRGLDRSGVSWRIRQAVHYKLLTPCGKVGNYNTFEETEVDRWIAGGCKYSWPEGGKG